MFAARCKVRAARLNDEMLQLRLTEKRELLRRAHFDETEAALLFGCNASLSAPASPTGVRPPHNHLLMGDLPLETLVTCNRHVSLGTCRTWAAPQGGKSDSRQQVAKKLNEFLHTALNRLSPANPNYFWNGQKGL